MNDVAMFHLACYFLILESKDWRTKRKKVCDFWL